MTGTENQQIKKLTIDDIGGFLKNIFVLTSDAVEVHKRLSLLINLESIGRQPVIYAEPVTIGNLSKENLNFGVICDSVIHSLLNIDDESTSTKGFCLPLYGSDTHKILLVGRDHLNNEAFSVIFLSLQVEAENANIYVFEQAINSDIALTRLYTERLQQRTEQEDAVAASNEQPVSPEQEPKVARNEPEQSTEQHNV